MGYAHTPEESMHVLNKVVDAGYGNVVFKPAQPDHSLWLRGRCL